MRSPLRSLPLVALLALAGCPPPLYIPGTRVADTNLNRELINVCEKYRHALEDRDAETLLAMASPLYFEDSGTPKAEDDYGYEGLKQVINARLAALKAVRYTVEYRNIEVKVDHAIKGARASVDIRYDASYQLATELGDRWERKQNDKRLELEYDGNKWMFTAGM
jgi:hypothetical protein